MVQRNSSGCNCIFVSEYVAKTAGMSRDNFLVIVPTDFAASSLPLFVDRSCLSTLLFRSKDA